MELVARDLAVRRGEDLIFDKLSFSLSGGEALVVTGRNGTGKSTLLRAIAGLIPLEGGSVGLIEHSGRFERAAEACHYLGHSNAMKGQMTVTENLAFWKSFMSTGTAGQGGVEPEEAAGIVGLSSVIDLPFGYLSAGQQRRIAFAKLLVADRPVWLLDEPTAAMDAASETLFARLVTQHLEKGGIAIAATHQELGLASARRIEMTGFAPVGEA